MGIIYDVPATFHATKMIQIWSIFCYMYIS